MFDYEAAIARVQAVASTPAPLPIGQPIEQPPLRGKVVWTRDNAPAPIRKRIRRAEAALAAAFPLSSADKLADNEANGLGRGLPVG